jgi:hypothetical protein
VGGTLESACGRLFSDARAQHVLLLLMLLLLLLLLLLADNM